MVEHSFTADEIAAFEREGLAGPFRHPLLASSDLGERTIRAFDAVSDQLAWPGRDRAMFEERLGRGMPWFQSGHTFVPELWEIASHPAIVERVKSILGEDVVLWGSAVLAKAP